MTLESIQEFVRQHSQVRVGVDLDLSEYSGVVEHDVNDMVVVVRAGTSLADLNAELAKSGQTIPYRSPIALGMVGAFVARNRPHLLLAQHGSWRDWVIGMTVVRGDGTIAKCGSKAVKNVAGYDVQKVMIGSVGRLAVVAEIILRTTPLVALAPIEITEGPHFSAGVGSDVVIQRVLPSDFEAALRANEDRLILADRAYHALWMQPGSAPKRFEHDWVFGEPSAAKHMIELDRRMKLIFDPDGRFSVSDSELHPRPGPSPTTNHAGEGFS